MAEYAGAWSYGNPSNGMQLIFVWTFVGNKCNWTVKGHNQNDWPSDPQHIGFGAFAGNFQHDYTYGPQPANGYQDLVSGSYNGTPGVWTNIHAAVSGSYNGADPSVTFNLQTPATAPGAPGITRVDLITQTTARTVYTAPSSNGGSAVTSYYGQISTNSAFTAIHWQGTFPGTDGTWEMGGLAANTTYWVRIRAANAIGSGAFSAAKSFKTTVNVPAATTGAAVARVSDTEHTVTWVNHPTASAPYTNILVQRSTDGAAWATIATLAGTATSYSDKTTKAGHSYRYQVRAQNAGGNSAFNSTGTIVTTPTPPTNFVAGRGTGLTAVLTWVNAAYPATSNVATAYQTLIEESNGAGGWTAQTTQPAGSTTWTDVAPLAGTTQYRIAHKATHASQPTLQSAWVVSAPLVTQAPPNPPSNLAPNGVVLDAAEPIVFTWSHNPLDGSPQTKYAIQYRVVGAGSWTAVAPVTSNVSQHTMPPGTLLNGQSYEWQVQTWGSHATASAWSPTAVFTTSARPTGTISAPTEGQVYGISRLDMTWVYFDAEDTPQAQWIATLFDANGVQLEVKTDVSEATSVTFATPVLDGLAYSVSLIVQDSSALWSLVDTVNFTVDYLPPELIDVQVTYDEDTGSVGIVLIPLGPVGGESVPAVTVDIERSIDGGPWVMIAEGIPPDSSVVDTAPSIHGETCYRVTVHSDLPSSRQQEPVCVTTTEGDNGYINAGPGFDEVFVIECELVVASTASREKALYHFAGRPRPVEFSGQSLNRVLSVKGGITGDPTTVYMMEALGQTPGIVLWRDPSGRRMWASIGEVQCQQVSMFVPNYWEVSFALTEVDFDG